MMMFPSLLAVAGIRPIPMSDRPCVSGTGLRSTTDCVLPLPCMSLVAGPTTRSIMLHHEYVRFFCLYANTNQRPSFQYNDDPRPIPLFRLLGMFPDCDVPKPLGTFFCITHHHGRLAVASEKGGDHRA